MTGFFGRVLDFKVSSRRSPYFVLSGQPDTKRAFHERLTQFFGGVPDKSITGTQFLQTTQKKGKEVTSRSPLTDKLGEIVS